MHPASADTSPIRPATLTDAPALGRVHVAAWREAYAHIFSGGFLAGLSVQDRTTRWERILTDNTDREHIVRVAEAGGEIVGFASVGRCRDADAPRTVELYSIYLLAAQYGSGLGQALLDAVLGDRPATLWVAADNPRALAFYRRNGFVADGAHRVEAHLENLADIRMVR